MENKKEERKYRPRKFSDLPQSIQIEKISKLQFKMKVEVTKFTCPNCGQFDATEDPEFSGRPNYCGYCGVKLPSDLKIDRTEKWKKLDMATFAGRFLKYIAEDNVPSDNNMVKIQCPNPTCGKEFYVNLALDKVECPACKVMLQKQPAPQTQETEPKKAETEEPKPSS